MKRKLWAFMIPRVDKVLDTFIILMMGLDPCVQSFV